MARIPSVKTIMNTGCNTETAKKIRALLEGKLNPLEVSEKCKSWYDTCFHSPSKHELVLQAVNELLDNHGVESVEDEERYFTDEGVRFCPKYSYSNTGDSYKLTLVRSHYNQAWLVTSHDELVEIGKRTFL
jgi:hypothetical protein